MEPQSTAIVLRTGLGSAEIDIQSLGVTIDSGDAFMAAKKWENAVQAYRTAASQSETIGSVVSPSDPAVVQAKGIADGILGIPWHLASPQQAASAQALAKQLPPLLSQALARNPQAVVSPVKASPGGSPTTNAAMIALWGAVAVGLGIMGYLIFRGPKENPVGSSSKRKGGSKLIAKGRSCLFEMMDGSEVRCKGGMLHDPSGRWWPKNSILIGPFRSRIRKASHEEFRGDAKDYLGSGYDASIGSVNTPPKPLSDWIYVGDVEHVFYIRSGRRAGYYQHPFNKGLQSIIRGKQRVRLYRRGRFMRLELPHGASLDDRGFVWP